MAKTPRSNLPPFEKVPPFDRYGNLPAGIYWVSWAVVEDHFGYNPWRAELISGLKEALNSFYQAGCASVYLDGSFVTNKVIPNDYDACWEAADNAAGLDEAKIDRVLLTCDAEGRSAQKAKYQGEFFPAKMPTKSEKMAHLDYFQRDTRHGGRRKGIIALHLATCGLPLSQAKIRPSHPSGSDPRPRKRQRTR